MVHLEYKSLVTNEIINHYLSIIKDEREKKDFMNTISKFDIRTSTNPIIESEEFYYKIWILRRGTKKKAHIKDYYSLDILKEKSQVPITLVEILEMVRINADVPDDFEEYCEIHFKDPSDEICRRDYLDDLKRAERFKRFMTQEEIRSFPFSIDEEKNSNKQNTEEEDNITIDLEDESDLKSLGFTIINLNDKREYDKLNDLQTTLEYCGKITESYGFDRYTNEFNEKLFPITKDDKQIKNIEKDIDNYNQALMNYNTFLKYLIKKYKIKQSGNIIKRVAFILKNENTNMLKHNSNYITTAIDHKTFS